MPTRRIGAKLARKTSPGSWRGLSRTTPCDARRHRILQSGGHCALTSAHMCSYALTASWPGLDRGTFTEKSVLGLLGIRPGRMLSVSLCCCCARAAGRHRRPAAVLFYLQSPSHALPISPVIEPTSAMPPVIEAVRHCVTGAVVAVFGAVVRRCLTNFLDRLRLSINES